MPWLLICSDPADGHISGEFPVPRNAPTTLNAASELLNNDWPVEFQTAFGSSESAENLVNYDNRE